MSQLHLIAGSNGAGKTTLFETVIRPNTGLPFVNADEIAKGIAGAELVTDDVSLQAQRLAAEQREQLIAAGVSHVAETVFSHPSKIALVHKAINAGFTVHLHIVVVPVELTVARVRTRVINGGHDVPEDKIRDRHARLWTYVADAIKVVQHAVVYDNSKAATPFRVIARFENGVARPGDYAPWPAWAPTELAPEGF